jgi:hypothetical protein
MAKTERIEVGFTGGQVISVRLEESQLGELLRMAQRHEGWYEVDAVEGKIAIDLRNVVFVKTAVTEHRVGFSSQ